jgi:hypothetical protein
VRAARAPRRPAAPASFPAPRYGTLWGPAGPVAADCMKVSL